MHIVNASLIGIYHICHRELWLHANHIRMETISEAVADGKLIHDSSYSRRASAYKEVVLEGGKIDFYDPVEKVVHEVKRSNRAENAHKAQLKYYLYLLEREGITGATGLLEYPTLRRTEEVFLEDSDRQSIPEWVSGVTEIMSSEKCPPVINKPICKQCSYYEFCYIDE